MIDLDRVTYTPEAAAAMLGISASAVREGMRRGDVPAVRVGRRRVIPRYAFDAWLKTGHQPELTLVPRH